MQRHPDASYKAAVRMEVPMSFAGIIRESIYPLKGTTRTVLLEILINCNHKDAPDFIFDNKKLPLKRGQWVTSLNTICEDTGLSVQQVRTAIGNLEKLEILTKQLTKQLTNRGRLITVADIDYYLSKKNHQQSNQQSNQQTPNKPLTTNNNNNNDNNEKTKTKRVRAKEDCPFNIDLFLNDTLREKIKNNDCPGMDFSGYVIPAYRRFMSGKSIPTNPIGSFRGFVKKCYNDYVKEYGAP